MNLSKCPCGGREGCSYCDGMGVRRVYDNSYFLSTPIRKAHLKPIADSNAGLAIFRKILAEAESAEAESYGSRAHSNPKQRRKASDQLNGVRITKTDLNSGSSRVKAKVVNKSYARPAMAEASSSRLRSEAIANGLITPKKRTANEPTIYVSAEKFHRTHSVKLRNTQAQIALSNSSAAFHRVGHEWITKHKRYDFAELISCPHCRTIVSLKRLAKHLKKAHQCTVLFGVSEAGMEKSHPISIVTKKSGRESDENFVHSINPNYFAPKRRSTWIESLHQSDDRLDATRYVGYLVRENGRFGSPVMHDGFDDESRP